MLALVAVIEGRVGREAKNLADVAASNWRYSRNQASKIDPRTDVIVLGDSLAKFGILPRLLEQGTNARAVNLAVCSGHMPSSYYVLRRAIEAGARPRAVVLDCSDEPIHPDRHDDRAPALTANMRNWPELLSLRECIDLGWEARDASAAAQMALARVLPSLRCRDQVRELTRARLAGAPWGRVDELTLARVNWERNAGAFVAPDIPATPHAFPAMTGDAGAPTPWARNPLTLAYAERLLGLARDHDIAVFWVLPPHRQAHQAQRERDGIDDYTTRVAAGLLARHPNLTVLDARQGDYPDDAFYDIVHLDRLGATTLSGDLAEVLASRRLAADPSQERWVHMKPFRAPTVSSLVEDLGQTRALLDARQLAIQADADTGTSTRR
jgi:hypothetical protein